jgi:hypothetical protein
MQKIDYKEEFIKIFNENIKREGSDKLLDWILKSDFFVAPASTKFHSAFVGGLVEHSVKVYKRFLNKIKSEFGENYQEKISDESIAIIGLLHDVCKINYYKEELRNTKDKNGNWIQKICYTVEDKLPYGHGEKSVYIINGFIRLTRDEAMAINWHMGGFDNRVQGGSYSMGTAFYAYPIALIFHVADLETTYLDEGIKFEDCD